MSRSPTPVQEESATRPERSFAGLAQQISGWTTNLLATVIVLAVGLAIGWQVIAWWKDQPQLAAAHELALATAQLPMVGDGQEFWTRGGLLKTERIVGSRQDALAAMRAFCRQSSPVVQRRPIGIGEQEFVAELFQQVSLEEAGNIATYQPPGQTAMVVAVDRAERRIVGCSFALPAAEGTWSLYHFRPTGGTAMSSTALITERVP